METGITLHTLNNWITHLQEQSSILRKNNTKYNNQVYLRLLVRYKEVVGLLTSQLLNEADLAISKAESNVSLFGGVKESSP